METYEDLIKAGGFVGEEETIELLRKGKLPKCSLCGLSPIREFYYLGEDKRYVICDNCNYDIKKWIVIICKRNDIVLTVYGEVLETMITNHLKKF